MKLFINNNENLENNVSVKLVQRLHEKINLYIKTNIVRILQIDINLAGGILEETCQVNAKS